MSVISAIETAYDNKSGVSIPLELFELANGVIDAKFCRFLARRNNLKIIEADDRSLLLVEAKRLETNKKLIDRFVLQFQDLQIGLRVSDFANDTIELSRPGAATNVSGSKGSLFVVEEEATSGGFGKKFESTHFVGTVNARFSVFCELFEKLPTEGSFASGRGCADDVKPRTEELLVVNIFETSEPISVIFKRIDVGFKMVRKIICQLQGFGRLRRTTPVGKLILSVSKNISERFFATFSFFDEYVAKFDKLAQIGFFLDDVGVVLGASSRESGVDKREQITMLNFAEVAGFAKFFLYGEIINRKSLGVKAQNGLKNKSVFDAIKVVSVDNGSDLRNDKPIFHEHGRE